MTAEFLERQRSIGNDLSTPMPQFDSGAGRGTLVRHGAELGARIQRRRRGSGVVLASTNEAALAVVPFAALKQHAVDVPDDASSLE